MQALQLGTGVMTMRNGLKAPIVALALASASGSACAMDRPMDEAKGCRVVGADMLPAEVGGAHGFCAAIEQAAGTAAPGAAFSVEVRVISPTRLSAIVTLSDGHVLPERKLAISDSKLRKSTVEWFAKGLAAEIAKTRT